MKINITHECSRVKTSERGQTYYCVDPRSLVGGRIPPLATAEIPNRLRHFVGAETTRVARSTICLGENHVLIQLVD